MTNRNGRLMDFEELQKLVVDALEEVKGVDIGVLDVREKASFTDVMVIVTGTSNRHVKALANNVVEEAKKHGVRPLGVEGEQQGEWILVDLGDVVVHVMLAEVRDFYGLERLWSVDVPEDADISTRQ